MEGVGQGVQLPHPAALLPEAGEEESQDAQTLVKGGGGELPDHQGCPCSGQDLVHMVDLAVLVVEGQIVGKIPGDTGELEVFSHHLPVGGDAQGLVGEEQL